MTDDRPTWEPLWLACAACGHAWDGWQPNNVAISVWVAAIEALRCPQCGTGPGKLVMRGHPLKPPGFTD